MASNPEWPDWLEKIWWREAWLTLEAAEPAVLPPYLGSTLRGALGHLFRATLCDGSGCRDKCERPDACRYYSLFEESSHGAKPFVLIPPPPPGLDDIALGGAVKAPFGTGAPRNGEKIPALRCEARWKFDPGGTFQFGLRVSGIASNALPAILEAIARFGLVVGTTQFRLVAARDGSGQFLYDRRVTWIPVQMPTPRKLTIEVEAVRRVRIAFLSPTVLKLDRAPTFAPEDFARRFFDRSIARAGQMHAACSGLRPPWVEISSLRAELASHRLFHYEFPRYSYRQDKRLVFDGVVGHIDLAGEIGAAMPWARAAEVLNFGERATFGQGKVRVLVLE